MQVIDYETKKDILLTIAVPTYNGSRTIRRTLDILMPQVSGDIEVLISDNGSTDNTKEIIYEYSRRYSFIRTHFFDKNVLSDRNFLFCMTNARGRFVMLLSDDDILVEGAINRIREFLYKNQGISLAYLDSVAFRDNYSGLDNCHRYKFTSPIERDICTSDKALFLHYCQRLFGFTSCHIWKVERIKSIKDPQKYYDTFFLQNYITILCSDKKDDLLGLVKGPCIAIGEYPSTLANLDIGLVEGKYYHKTLEFACEHGYPKSQMEKFYIWKICYQGRHVIAKQRMAGIKKSSCINLIKYTYKYPYAWIALYPFLLIPPLAYRVLLSVKYRICHRSVDIRINRPT